MYFNPCKSLGALITPILRTLKLRFMKIRSFALCHVAPSRRMKASTKPCVRRTGFIVIRHHSPLRYKSIWGVFYQEEECEPGRRLACVPHFV